MEDKTPKQKKGVRRVAKAAGSPIPCGPTGGAMDDMPSACGHMACTGGKCNVRYVGPVSHMRDHHVIHAARQASHVWSAAIVTGLAVVLTGALGYAALGAESSGTLYGEFQQVNSRLDRIEAMVSKLLDRCEMSARCGNDQPTEQNQCVDKCKQEYGDSLEKANACIKERCAKPTDEQPKPDTAQCKANCEAKYMTLDITAEEMKKMVNACMEQQCPAQPTGDACTLKCKEQNKDDQKAIDKCLIENKCVGAPANTANDQCVSQCKEKWGDNLEGVNSCLKESCGVMPAPAGNTGDQLQGGAATPTGAAAPSSASKTEACLKACADTRAACFKKAGSNFSSLRVCASAESTCKSACYK